MLPAACWIISVARPTTPETPKDKGIRLGPFGRRLCGHLMWLLGPQAIALWVRAQPMGQNPEVLAALRNAAIAWLRDEGVTKIAQASRDNAYRVVEVLTQVGILKL